MKFTAIYIIATLAFVSCKKSKDSGAQIISPNPISSPCSSIEYNVDIALSDTFDFIENYNNPWDYGAPNPEGYYDFTQITGIGIIQPFGEFNIYVTEYADTVILSDTVLESYFLIAKGHVNPIYIEGHCSINFKKLMRQGGGSFNGTFTVTHGSAGNCNVNAFTNPLIVTGTLDVSTHMVALWIKGKAYF